MLPTFGDRHAITLWYYDQTERAAAVRQAKEEGTASKVATASAQSQQRAKVQFRVMCEVVILMFVYMLVCEGCIIL